MATGLKSSEFAKQNDMRADCMSQVEQRNMIQYARRKRFYVQQALGIR